MLSESSRLLPSSRFPSCLQAHGALARCSQSPLFIQGMNLTSHIISSRRRPAGSTLKSKGKTNHHVSSPQNAPYFPDTVHYQLPFSSRTSSLHAPFILASHGRFQCVVPQASGVDDSGREDAHDQQTGRGRGRGGGRGGGQAGRGGRGRGEQRNRQEPGRGTGKGGRASRGRGGFPHGDKSREERVLSLEVCIKNGANPAHLTPNSTVFCMYNMAKHVEMGTHRGVQHGSSKCADVVDAARNLIRQLLGSSSSVGAPASALQPPVQQLDSKHLSLLAWSLSVMVGFDESLSAEARQLCYALAERAAQPRVIRTVVPDVQDVHPEACRNWAGVLYGLAKVGVKCSDDARVKQVFHVCMEQELPDLLSQGQRCLPQSISTVALACVDAGYEGSMEPFISAVARRVGEPSKGGVDEGIMARTVPQDWSNLFNACAKLEQRGVRAGGGMGIIAKVGAAALAGALQKPVQHQPKPQELANALWGLSFFKWYDANIIGVLAHALVEHVDSSTSQGISNTLWALAKFGWFDEGVVSKLAAGMVERIDSSTPQELSSTLWVLAKFEWYDEGIVSKLAAGMVEHIHSSTSQSLSNTLWALSILGWYDSGVYDALLVALLNRSDQLAPQQCSNAMYSCAVASHGGSAVDKLAQVISKQDVSKRGGWIEQALANALYAWAVLGCIGIASDSLDMMAQHLLHEVNDRGPAAFISTGMTQLYLAHLEAERVGLQGGGLSTANGMLQAAAERHIQNQAKLQKIVKYSGGSAGAQQAFAALQEAGYEVKLGGRVGQDEYQVEMLVRHKLFPRGIAVGILSGSDLLRHPPGQLSGKIRLRLAQIWQRCDGLVVLSEAATKQPGLVVQRLEEEMNCAAAALRLTAA
uniref:RAP domain-containing protein n=1 Tax=Dunaliella tertiolecta TaxID=3047 RepID=A0A7S3QME1_DUNTE